MISRENLELKHFCKNFKEIRKTLSDIGAKKLETKKQKDYFFNLPKNKDVPTGVKARLKMRQEDDQMYLLYYERPNFKKDKDTKSKVRLLDADKATLKFMEESLGVLGIVNKRREIWQKGSTVFHLDNIVGVGNIFEIELRKSGKLNKKDIAEFTSYQKAVSPYLGKVVKGSNIDLVLNKV
jgi:adenylate cyclase class 2